MMLLQETIFQKEPRENRSSLIFNTTDAEEEAAFLAALYVAEEDIKAGRLVSNEDARKQLELWTSK
ncbi:MAG: hypothetical protein A3F67_05335 [Verrucomicrobia bacterium RIFCSPHIGHO2_12_FULL_41_10]|nr:MAG: hypothetical protein A3F67_05335 [Verrucomicrobia bacterium RIFCSPHIGHO2_12_FULL_41_10]HLB32705.1 hypothetical protein [Chthoniobacterales bacterium]